MCTKLYLNCKKFYQKMLFLCIIFIISDTRADIYYKSFILHLNRTQTSEAHFSYIQIYEPWRIYSEIIRRVLVHQQLFICRKKLKVLSDFSWCMHRISIKWTWLSYLIGWMLNLLIFLKQLNRAQCICSWDPSQWKVQYSTSFLL